MQRFEVPHDEWSLFTNGVSRLHSRWLLRIVVIDRDGNEHTLVHRAPLREIAVVDDGITITVGTARNIMVTHFVEKPASMALEKAGAGPDSSHRGICISWENGINTILRFTPAVSVLERSEAGGLAS